MGSISSKVIDDSSKPMAHCIINSFVFRPNENIDISVPISYTKHEDPAPYIKCSYFGSDKYIVFAHGNASTIYDMRPFLIRLSNLTRTNVIAFEYPGYSCCEGNPSEKGCYDNIRKMIEHLVLFDEIDSKNIYLVGQSLGTGIVVNFASECNWDNPIMLISPYKSIISIVLDSNSCESRNNIDMFESIDRIDNIRCPIKIIHGTKDDVINISHGQELYQRSKNKMEPVWVECGHNDILERITLEHWNDFLQRQQDL